MTNDLAEILHDLLNELSTELDLHHNAANYGELRSTFAPMQRAAAALEQIDRPLPDAYRHVLALFVRSQH